MSALLDELPQDILDACAALRDSRSSRRRTDEHDDTLARICEVVIGQRDKNVNGRRLSGIEDVWNQCEEAYHGIDNANRHEFHKARWCKPVSMAGTVQKETHGEEAKGPKRSTIFVRLTSRYVDAAAAKLAEILLSPDDRSFSIQPTPVPELVNAKDDETQLRHPELGIPLERDPRPEELPQSAPPGTHPSVPPGASGVPPTANQPVDLTKAPGVPLKVKDLAQEKLEKAEKSAKKAENQIADWLTECGYRREARRLLFDAPKLGVGVLKGPFPVMTIDRAWTNMEHGYRMIMKRKVKPSVKCISPWDFFPDSNCGEDIHSGNSVFERDRISLYELTKLKKQPGYLPPQIDLVIQQGPNKTFAVDDVREQQRIEDERFDIWYGIMQLSREQVVFINDLRTDLDEEKRKALNDEMGDDLEEVSMSVTLVNDQVIRAVRNHLESNEFYYHTMPWSRRDGHWAGIGVAEQGAAAQRITNAAMRGMLDNAGVAAGAQIVMMRGILEPADGSDELSAIKFWYMNSDAQVDDIEKAFQVYTFPDMQAPLMNIYNTGKLLFEETTSIPLVTQGQSGDSTPNTLGQTELQNNNANQLLRDVGYRYDDGVGERMIKQHYEWILLSDDVDPDCKGDFQIDARGSATLVERSIANQYLASIATLVANPIYGRDPKKWMDEIDKANKVNPVRIAYTEAEQEKIDNTPPPPPPAVEAAKVRADVDMKKIEAMNQKAQLDAQTRTEIAARDTDRDKAYVDAEAQRTAVERDLRVQELQLKLELARLDYAMKHQISVEELKVKMADTTMKLQVQKDLAAKDRAAEAIEPPTEPPGRAEDGKSFQQ